MTTTTPQTDDYTAVRDLPAPPAEVLALFTSAEGVSRWWGPTTGDGGVGGTLVTTFSNYGVNAMRIREAGPSRVVWEPVVVQGTTPTAHTQEWLGTTVEFDVVATDSGSRLRFRHAGLTPRLACFTECFDAWSHFMASIEACVRTGTGTPFGA